MKQYFAEIDNGTRTHTLISTHTIKCENENIFPYTAWLHGKGAGTRQEK